MPTFHLETLREPYPAKGVSFRCHKDKGFSRDSLSPSMTSVHRVEGVNTKDEAVAVALEKLAGINVSVYPEFGCRKEPTFEERKDTLCKQVMDVLESFKRGAELKGITDTTVYLNYSLPYTAHIKYIEPNGDLSYSGGGLEPHHFKPRCIADLPYESLAELLKLLKAASVLRVG